MSGTRTRESRPEEGLILIISQTQARRPTPPYDERFLGYGKNKIQHVAHLRRLGFGFAVFPNHFLIHVPHPRSKAKDAWTSSWSVHRGIDKLYDNFLKELDSLPATPVVTICKKKKRMHRR